VYDLIFHTKGRTQTEDVREEGVEGIWTSDGGNNRRLEKKIA
jgi:hypothetical protein